MRTIIILKDSEYQYYPYPYCVFCILSYYGFYFRLRFYFKTIIIVNIFSLAFIETCKIITERLIKGDVI